MFLENQMDLSAKVCVPFDHETVDETVYEPRLPLGFVSNSSIASNSVNEFLEA